MTRFRVLLGSAVVAMLFGVAAHAQEKKFEMTPVNYDGLKQEVLKHRGKVLVVDFWAGY